MGVLYFYDLCYNYNGDSMSIVLVSVEKENISFSKYNKKINEQNLNNTNVIDVKSLKFTEDYIIENIELVSTFINLIILKFNINKVVIKNLEIAETILKLVKNLSNIKYINFTEDKELTYTICTLLLENMNLEKIECYSLPIIMFYRFNKDQIETRCEILSKSTFIKINNINTFSDVFNKDKIIIWDYLTEEDVNDLICFLDTNKVLKKIEFRKYNRKNLEATLSLLKQNNLKKITIIIYENEETIDELLKDIKLFDKFNKEYNVNIKIKYSKEYKEKNRIKELNIIMLRNIILLCLIIGIVLFIAYKLLEQINNDSIVKNMEEINKQIDEYVKEESINNTSGIEEENETEKEQYISSYYKNYSKVYEELIKLNEDTVGWLTVNNTKINYPIVQTIDNDYYLDHAYDKTKNTIGWVFADYRNDMDNISQNTIIYGHSMVKSGLMFSTLEKVLNSDWYNNENNMNITFSIKGKDIKWKIFSIYTIQNTTDYLYTDFSTEESFKNFIQKIKDRSIKDFNVDLNSSDKILTLSTCYKDDDHRVVVHAKMI